MTITTGSGTSKTVFILDASKFLQEGIEFCLIDFITDGKLRLIKALNIDEAYKLFNENKGSINLIFIDGCVNSETLNTTAFCQHVKKEIEGKAIIYATSSDKKNRKTQIESGCMFEVSEKAKIPKIIESFLTIA
jgi:hypothetical protein